MTEAILRTDFVNTVLGALAPAELGVVLVHESLLSVVPGAQYAYDIKIDRAEIFEILAMKLRDFKAAGGSTIVDKSGMFHGRDLPLYEALSASTGVHIVASTGMGPEENLGGYFLTPQTNPPTPWPAEKFADLFSKEVTAGMVIPRLERRQPAGIVATAADHQGITATEISLFKGSARTSLATGIPVSIRFGVDALAELDHVLREGLPANRVIVGDLDRRGAPVAEVAQKGAYVALDHVGQNEGSEHLNDEERANLVVALIGAGFENNVLLSSSATGVAKGHAPVEVAFSYLLTDFVPLLKSKGVSDASVNRILVQNPREILTVKGL